MCFIMNMMWLELLGKTKEILSKEIQFNEDENRIMRKKYM